jgi:hypothetical protein
MIAFVLFISRTTLNVPLSDEWTEDKEEILTLDFGMSIVEPNLIWV